MVVHVCLEQGADLHNSPDDATATHCLLFLQNQNGFTFLVLAHLGSPGKRAVNIKASPLAYSRLIN